MREEERDFRMALDSLTRLFPSQADLRQVRRSADEGEWDGAFLG